MSSPWYALLTIDGYHHGGIGLHIWNITPQMFLDFQKVFISSSALIY